MNSTKKIWLLNNSYMKLFWQIHIKSSHFKNKYFNYYIVFNVNLCLLFYDKGQINK